MERKLKTNKHPETNPTMTTFAVVETDSLTKKEARSIGTRPGKIIITATSAEGHVYANRHAHGCAESSSAWNKMSDAAIEIARATEKGAGINMSHWTYIGKCP